MIIGITGNSGSGKTIVSNMLKEKLRCYLIDADDVQKELSKKGHEYYNGIVAVFGETILDENREIVRQKLAEIIYSNPNKRELLNDLTNIYIVDAIKRQVDGLPRRSTVIIDVPRLVECGLGPMCDVIISVLADREIKLDRICARDNIDRETAEKRLDIQQDDQFYLDNSDYVIENNDDNLEEKVDLIVEEMSCRK